MHPYCIFYEYFKINLPRELLGFLTYSFLNSLIVKENTSKSIRSANGKNQYQENDVFGRDQKGLNFNIYD